MEALVLVGLLGVGYLLSEGRAPSTAPPPASAQGGPPPENALAASRRYGASMGVNAVRAEELRRAQNRERAAEFPTVTGAIDPRARMLGTRDGIVRSELSGMEMDRDDFQNPAFVQPFFGGGVKGMNVGTDTTSLMEKFAGAPGPGNSRVKRESGPMFSAAESAVATVAGAPALMSSPQVAERAADSMRGLYRSNELPFAQVTVGRGLGQGFAAAPTGGFHPLGDRDLVMPKGVDDLRAGVQPNKEAFEGRMNAGASAVKNPALLGAVSKNRPETGFQDAREFFGSAAAAGSAPPGRPDTSPVVRPARGGEGGVFHLNPGGAGAAGPGQHAEWQLGDRRLGPEGGAADMRNAAAARARAPLCAEDDMRGMVRLGTTMRDAAGLPLGLPSAPAPRGEAGLAAGYAARAGRQQLTSDLDRPGLLGGGSEPRGPAGPGQEMRATGRESSGCSEVFLAPRAMSSGVGLGGAAPDQPARETIRQHCADDPADAYTRNARSDLVPSGGTEVPQPAPPGATGREMTETNLREPAPGAPQITRGGYAMADVRASDTMRSFQLGQTAYAGCPARAEPTGYTRAHEAAAATSTVSANRTVGEFEYFGIPLSDARTGTDLAQLYTATFNQAKESLATGAARAPGGHGPGGKAAVSVSGMGAVAARPEAAPSDHYASGQGTTYRRAEAGSRLRTPLGGASRLDTATLSWLDTNPYVTNRTLA